MRSSERKVFAQTNTGGRCAPSGCYFLSYCVLSYERYGGNLANALVFHGECLSVLLCVCLAGCDFSPKLVPACAAAASLCVRVCRPCACLSCLRARVCVWYGASKRQSNLNPEIKGRGCPCLSFNYAVCGEGGRKRRC